MVHHNLYEQIEDMLERSNYVVRTKYITATATITQRTAYTPLTIRYMAINFKA